ncbi:MAG TPA: hypothetical protein VFJ29_04515 [Candidatus Kapabacteria bacterium]|nr:hypothetical protein [Candidatus Kapabacteria bacterium]
MKRKIFTTIILLCTVAGSFFTTQCGYLSQLQNTIVNLQRCKFKLGSVDNFTLAGVSLAGKHSLSDFSLIGDGAKLAAAFANRSLPAQFTLNVLATNPNDGTGGTTSTSATLVGMPWNLLVDGKQTISGDIGTHVQIPGKGQSATIPLPASVDLYQFFGDKQYEDIVNLALAMGGANGSAGRLTLRGTPKVSTPLGDISYPNPINIVDKEFRN